MVYKNTIHSHWIEATSLYTKEQHSQTTSVGGFLESKGFQTSFCFAAKLPTRSISFYSIVSNGDIGCALADIC